MDGDITVDNIIMIFMDMECFNAVIFKYKVVNNFNRIKINKSVFSKHCWGNDHTFNFHSAKIICKTNSVFDLDFLEAFHVHKNHNNVVNCDFSMPSLSDYWTLTLNLISHDSFYFSRLYKNLLILIS